MLAFSARTTTQHYAKWFRDYGVAWRSRCKRRRAAIERFVHDLADGAGAAAALGAAAEAAIDLAGASAAAPLP